MKLSEKELKVQLTEIVNDVLAEAHLKKGDLFVLGCSTSEVVGGHIGKNSSAEVKNTDPKNNNNKLSFNGVKQKTTRMTPNP